MIRALWRKARAEYYRRNRQKVFSRIYREHLWGGSESRSGSGSGLDTTGTLRDRLPKLIAEYGIRTMSDIPCGDFVWMDGLNIDAVVESYHGFDIVPELIAGNRERHGRDSVRFDVLDIVKEVPPAADLILCRHLLIHLPFADALAALANFKRSGSRYLLISNQPDHAANEEILWTGSFRPLNLCAAPFRFPEPIERIPDSEASDRRTDLSLFRLDSLPV